MQRMAGYTPTAFLHFLDRDPRDRTEGLTFDRYHGIGEISDDLLLLFGRENVFEYVDVDEWHDWFVFWL